MNNIKLTPEIEAKARKYVQLFSEVAKYLAEIFIPNAFKQVTKPPLETISFRVMVDLLAQEQVKKIDVEQAAKEKVQNTSK